MSPQRKPYKVIAYEPGAANVIDRATGERVGYVLQDFYSRWTGYMADTTALLPATGYRSDAAANVWDRFVTLSAAGAI